MDVWKRDAAPAAVSKDVKTSSTKKLKKDTAEDKAPPPPPDLPEDNFIFALLNYLQERLGHYSSYCVSCQAPHSCWNPDGGVVCCERESMRLRDGGIGSSRCAQLCVCSSSKGRPLSR